MIFLSKLIGLRANRIQLLKLSGFQKLPEESLKEYQTQIVILLLVTLVTRKVVSRILINCANAAVSDGDAPDLCNFGH